MMETGAEGDGALVLFSGGQDSTTCLAWALERYPAVETLGFFYGQRHRIELDCRADILAQLRRSHGTRLGQDHSIDISSPMAALGATAMTGEIEIEMTAEGLPNTFVPGRNLLFFTYAAALADRRNLRRIVGGMCETDFSGYPDCRDDTIKALQVALNLGMQRRFVLETPLMWIDKAGTWALAAELGILGLIVEHTHTCYLGDRSHRHDWGYGCGACPACDLRKAGFSKWSAERNTGRDQRKVQRQTGGDEAVPPRPPGVSDD
jgi:7-cyano-7-deazaguanine synthase